MSTETAPAPRTLEEYRELMEKTKVIVRSNKPIPEDWDVTARTMDEEAIVYDVFNDLPVDPDDFVKLPPEEMAKRKAHQLFWVMLTLMESAADYDEAGRAIAERAHEVLVPLFDRFVHEAGMTMEEFNTDEDELLEPVDS